MKKWLTLLLALALGLGAVALAAPEADRAGNPIALPESIEKIVCLAPSTTQVILALGQGDKLVAIDTYSAM